MSEAYGHIGGHVNSTKQRCSCKNALSRLALLGLAHSRWRSHRVIGL